MSDILLADSHFSLVIKYKTKLKSLFLGGFNKMRIILDIICPVIL